MRMYLNGMLMSVSVFALTLILSIPLACLIALFRVRKTPVLSFLLRILIDVMRGTPLILQLLFFYFIPPFVFHFNIGRFASVIGTFSINYAAYFAEIFRSGYISIPQGQFEACKILGLSRGFSFFRIYVPQIAKRIMPAFSGEVITLVKDTALSSTLGVLELFAIARKRSSAIFSVYPIVGAGLFYFVFNAVVAYVFSTLEKRFDRYRL